MKIENLINYLNQARLMYSKDAEVSFTNLNIYLDERKIASANCNRKDEVGIGTEHDIEKVLDELFPPPHPFNENFKFLKESTMNQKEEKTKQFWMVLAENSTYTQVKHDSFTIALKEAKRLAKLHQGTKFFILELISVCIVEDPVHVEMLREPEDDIPF